MRVEQSDRDIATFPYGEQSPDLNKIPASKNTTYSKVKRFCQSSFNAAYKRLCKIPTAQLLGAKSLIKALKLD